jgi:predicted transcriptional regulator
MFTSHLNFSIFSFTSIIPKDIFHFTNSFIGKNDSEINHRFKMILWSIIAGTRGGVNRAKILNLVKDNPLNANKIATVLNLDYKTVVHHVKILSKNELIVKAEKDYGAEYQLTQIMKDNQIALEEIMKKIGTK